MTDELDEGLFKRLSPEMYRVLREARKFVAANKYSHPAVREGAFFMSLCEAVEAYEFKLRMCVEKEITKFP